MKASQARLGAHTVLGAGCWILTVVYLAVQPVVIAGWETPYDVTINSISDLGVTRCGSYTQLDGRQVYVCSPRHALMNTAFVVAGLLTGAGAVLTRGVWPRGRLTLVGVALVVLAGLGGVLVGMAPADVNLAAHAAGALVQGPGAVGPLLLGVTVWPTERRVATFSLLCGVVGTAACLLYFGQAYLGLGQGLMERLAFDPLTVWTTGMGVVLLGRSWRPADTW